MNTAGDRGVRGGTAKRASRFLFFVGVQLLVIFVLFELSLRLLRPYIPGLGVYLYLPSASTDFDQIDSTEELFENSMLGFLPCVESAGFVLNSRSFRTREYLTEKLPGEFRIAAMGDSFTFSSSRVPHREMWPIQLERRLHKLGHHQVKAFALGVPGVGPQFELRLWELERSLIRPDLVVAAFFVGNDFIDEQDHDLDSMRESLPPRLSYTYRLVRNLARAWSARPVTTLQMDKGQVDGPCGVSRAESQDPVEPMKFDSPRYIEIEGDRMRLGREDFRERFLDLADRAARVLARFHAEVSATGSSFLVLIIPDEYQVNQIVRDGVYQADGRQARDYDIDLPQRRLSELLDREGILYLDLLPLFRKESRTRRLYWIRNTHWNWEGNALAGAALGDFIHQVGLIPRTTPANVAEGSPELQPSSR